MAPKKIDPETRERDYEVYKETQQFKKIEEIHDQIVVHLKPYISQTSRDHDLNGKYQHLWNKIYELSALMKVKAPFKKIEHQWMRSIYFGEKRKSDKNDPPCNIDGFVCEFEPIDADSQHHLRQALIKKISNIAGEKDNFDLETYSKSRAQLKKGISQLFSLLKAYSKKSFKVIYQEKFMEVMKPFSDLLEINMKLVLFQIRYTSEDDKFIHSFKKNAIIQKYCDCLERVLQILMTYQSKPIIFKIIPSNIFKKLSYTNLTKIEHFYLDPFTDSFTVMKKGLCALFTTGVNFWKLPIEENKKFVTDLQELVRWQIVCERHFGNSLVRDQINFMAEALSSIDKANDLSRKYMIQKDPNCMEIAIPKIVAFKTIQHMSNYRDKEQSIAIREEQKNKLIYGTMYGSQYEDQKSASGSETLKMSKMSDGLNKSKSTFQNSRSMFKTNEFQQQRKNLGRYWIWENYCDEDFKNSDIQEAVSYLKDINKAVQQDIEDTIVIEGMLPTRKERHNQEKKEAAETLKNMKTYHNADKPENMRRPPELWNFSRVFDEQHKFRSIADPKKCYIDGRIQKLDRLLIKISNYLMNYNKKDWNELVRRVIDFYNGKANSDPAFEEI